MPVAGFMGAQQDFFRGMANGEPRPEGPRRGGVLGEGCESPPHQLGGLWGRCKLPLRGPGRKPGANRLMYIF